MPSSFRLINNTLVGQGGLNPNNQSISSLALQDLTLANASSQKNKTVLRERRLLKALNPKPFRSHFTLLKGSEKK